MNRVLVVIFSEASKMFEARDSLKGLDHEGLLTLYEYALIMKKADGETTVLEDSNHEGVKTLVGGSIGSFIGLLGGPTGLAIGAAAGFLAGLTADLDNARVSADFVDEIAKELTPGKFALVAEVEEEWTRWVDLRMEELSGEVYRYALSEVMYATNSGDLGAMKADLALLKAEHAESSAERKAKLYEKINRLETRIQEHLEKAKQQREQAARRAKARADVLKAKASAITAKGSGDSHPAHS